MLWASQVAPGNENALRLRVYGEKGGLAWSQEDPNYLRYAPFGEPPRLIRRGGAGAGPPAARVTRVPAGHPEGYLEGFATIYATPPSWSGASRAGSRTRERRWCPRCEDGVAGVAFIEAVVASSRDDGAWTVVGG